MCYFVYDIYKCIQVNIKTIHSSSKVAFDWPIMMIYSMHQKNAKICFLFFKVQDIIYDFLQYFIEKRNHGPVLQVFLRLIFKGEIIIFIKHYTLLVKTTTVCFILSNRQVVTYSNRRLYNYTTFI